LLGWLARRRTATGNLASVTSRWPQVLGHLPGLSLNRPMKKALRRLSWSQTAQAEKLEPRPQVLVALGS
jgi:hypothetical protein